VIKIILIKLGNMIFLSRAAQLKKIETAFHQLGKELIAVQL
jgi:hypothetical protein